MNNQSDTNQVERIGSDDHNYKAVKSQVPDRYDVYIDGIKYWHGTKRQVEAIAAKYGFTVEFTQGAEL